MVQPRCDDRFVPPFCSIKFINTSTAKSNGHCSEFLSSWEPPHRAHWPLGASRVPHSHAPGPSQPPLPDSPGGGGWLSTFQLSITTRCSSFILYISTPIRESAIYPRSPGFFYWRMVLETKIRVLGMPFALWVSFF